MYTVAGRSVVSTQLALLMIGSALPRDSIRWMRIGEGGEPFPRRSTHEGSNLNSCLASLSRGNHGARPSRDSSQVARLSGVQQRDESRAFCELRESPLTAFCTGATRLWHEDLCY